MKKVNVTFSLPVEVKEALHAAVPSRQFSSFVSGAIQRAIDEKRSVLKEAYKQAEQDAARNEIIDEWSITDVEGLE